MLGPLRKGGPLDDTPLWPLAVYSALVLFLTATIVAVSALLGQRHRERATGIPYEGGVAATGSARLRFGARFYLVAVLFIIFDLEVIYVLAWAAAARDVGWTGYVEMAVFVGVLVAALVYVVRIGALDVGGSRRGPLGSRPRSPREGRRTT